MRIISDFHDFYDSIQIYNSSKEFIWKRKTEEMDLSKFPELSKRFSSHRYLDKESDNKIYLPEATYYWKKRVEVKCILFNISGEWIPSILVRISDKSQYIYSSEDLMKIPEFKEVENHNKDRVSEIIKLRKFLDTPIILDVDIDCPCFVISRTMRSFRIILNPVLRSYNFQRKMDVFTIYQKIDYYLMNKALPENKIVNISDKDRLIQHGFDNKISFRKRK